MHSSSKIGLTRMSAESTTCDFGTEFAGWYFRDLKSRVPKGTYRFDSGPGHNDGFGILAALGISVAALRLRSGLSFAVLGFG